MCRALQKERNDLNNRLSLLQEQGDKGKDAPPEAQPQDPSAEQEEVDNDEEEEEEEEDSEDSAQGDGLETGSIHQAPRPPEVEPALAATDTATMLPASQPVESPTTHQD